MWWDEFESQLTNAFNTYISIEKSRVHSNDMILRILNRNILVDLIQANKAYIKLELAKTPVTITYESALAEFRNQVEQKFLPELSSSNNRNTRRIN